jgi:hypothetical protein
VVRLFSGANPLNLLFLFFLGIVLRLNAFTDPVIPTALASDGWLYKEILELLYPFGSKFPILYPILTYLLIFIQAIVLNGFTNEKRVYNGLNLLTAFSVVFLTALIPSWNSWSSVILVNLMLVWIWPKMTNLYYSEKVKTDVFNAGFAIGVCSFLYFPALLLFPLILVALIITRPFKLAEWIVSFTGLLLPFYFFFVFQYFFNNQFQPNSVFTEIQWQSPLAYLGKKYEWVHFVLLLIPALAGFIYSRISITRMVVLNRKIWALNSFLLLFCLMLIFLNGKNGSSLSILFIPSVFYVAAFYAFSKTKVFPELTVWIGIGWIFIRQFFS